MVGGGRQCVSVALCGCLSQFNLPKIGKDGGLKSQSQELTDYLARLKRKNEKQNKELLKFDANLESGNLDKVEAQ